MNWIVILLEDIEVGVIVCIFVIEGNKFIVIKINKEDLN